MKEPTERQSEALAFIKGFLKSNGYPPTIREIRSALGVKSTNAVSDILEALQKKGLIERDRLKGRGIRIVEAQLPRDDAGVQRAMVPVYGMEQRAKIGDIHPPRTENDVTRRKIDLAVQVAGNCANGLGILDGDVLFLSRKYVHSIKSGAIVVCQVDDFLVIRRAIVDRSLIRLAPVSGGAATVVVPYSDVESAVVGVVVAMHRRLKLAARAA